MPRSFSIIVRFIRSATLCCWALYGAVLECIIPLSWQIPSRPLFTNSVPLSESKHLMRSPHWFLYIVLNDSNLLDISLLGKYAITYLEYSSTNVSTYFAAPFDFVFIGLITSMCTSSSTRDVFACERDRKFNISRHALPLYQSKWPMRAFQSSHSHSTSLNMPRIAPYPAEITASRPCLPSSSRLSLGSCSTDTWCAL